MTISIDGIAKIISFFTLALLSFWGVSVTYALRVNLSVALVAMVNSTFANANSDAMHNPECKDNTEIVHKVRRYCYQWKKFMVHISY